MGKIKFFQTQSGKDAMLLRDHNVTKLFIGKFDEEIMAWDNSVIDKLIDVDFEKQVDLFKNLLE